MNRAALEHLLRAAAAITGESTFYVVGTAAIAPSVPEGADIPSHVLRSREADLIPASESARSIDLIDGALGLDSTFDGTYGYYADGVDFSTVSHAPKGWRERTVVFSTPGTHGATGLCMEPHDLAIAKLCAGRDKDLEFLQGLIDAGLVRGDTLLERLALVEAPESVLSLAGARLRRLVEG